MKILLEAMVKKLSYTATLELVPLMEVPGVKQVNRDFFHLQVKAVSLNCFF